MSSSLNLPTLSSIWSKSISPRLAQASSDETRQISMNFMMVSPSGFVRVRCGPFHAKVERASRSIDTDPGFFLNFLFALVKRLSGPPR
jgi:hypothetical protein